MTDAGAVVSVPNSARTRCESATDVPSVHWVEAIPFASVVAIGVLTVPPPAVTMNVTACPALGAPVASTIRTLSGFGRGTPTGPVWLLPLIIVVPAGAVVEVESLHDVARQKREATAKLIIDW